MSGYWGSWQVATACAAGRCTTTVRDTAAAEADDRSVYITECSEGELVARGDRGRLLVCPRAFDPSLIANNAMENFEAQATWSAKKLPKGVKLNLKDVRSADIQPSKDGSLSVKVKGGGMEDIKVDRSNREIRISNPDVDVEIRAPKELLPQIEAPEVFAQERNE